MTRPLGITLASKNSTPYSATPESIGARSDFSQLPSSSYAAVGVKPSTHTKIAAILSAIQLSGCLFPSSAGSLAGKLNSYGQLYLPAKPAFQPISQRYHHDHIDNDGQFLLTDELRSSARRTALYRQVVGGAGNGGSRPIENRPGNGREPF